MDSKLIYEEEWDSLLVDPRFRKYRHYLELWLEHVKDNWADGLITGELANADAAGKTQFLKDQIGLEYEDIHEFFVGVGHVKEAEETEDADTEDSDT